VIAVIACAFAVFQSSRSGPRHQKCFCGKQVDKKFVGDAKRARGANQPARSTRKLITPTRPTRMPGPTKPTTNWRQRRRRLLVRFGERHSIGSVLSLQSERSAGSLCTTRWAGKITASSAARDRRQPHDVVQVRRKLPCRNPRDPQEPDRVSVSLWRGKYQHPGCSMKMTAGSWLVDSLCTTVCAPANDKKDRAVAPRRSKQTDWIE